MGPRYITAVEGSACLRYLPTTYLATPPPWGPSWRNLRWVWPRGNETKPATGICREENWRRAWLCSATDESRVNGGGSDTAGQRPKSPALRNLSQSYPTMSGNAVAAVNVGSCLEQVPRQGGWAAAGPWGKEWAIIDRDHRSRQLQHQCGRLYLTSPSYLPREASSSAPRSSATPRLRTRPKARGTSLSPVEGSHARWLPYPRLD